MLMLISIATQGQVSLASLLQLAGDLLFTRYDLDAMSFDHRVL